MHMYSAGIVQAHERGFSYPAVHEGTRDERQSKADRQAAPTLEAFERLNRTMPVSTRDAAANTDVEAVTFALKVPVEHPPR